MAFPPPHHTNPSYPGNGPPGPPHMPAFQIRIPQSPQVIEQYQRQNYSAYQTQYENIPPFHYGPPQFQFIPPQNYSQQSPSQVFQHTDHTAVPQLPQPPTPSPIVDAQLPKNTISPIEYQLLLLKLADEYFQAAQERTPTVQDHRELDLYHKLIATGLACLEAVLKTWRLQPRLEAVVRLRYANILYEETDNDAEAEAALIKGISVCERNRLLDSKYSMQHLLVKVLFKSNPKASLKFLDGIIYDAEALEHIPWVYAFRFLRVTLSLETSYSNELSSVLSTLRSISNSAKQRGDIAIFVTSAVFEAAVYLRSSNSDCIEQAQRALAAARSLQLNEVTKELPQIVTLLNFLDLCCSLQESTSSLSGAKLQAMQMGMDQASNDPQWKEDGSFFVPLRLRSTALLTGGAGNVVRNEIDGDRLCFQWLPKRDVQALGYFLSGALMSYRNGQDGHKAEKYFREGLKISQGDNSYAPHDSVAGGMQSTMSQFSWRSTFRCYTYLYLIFVLCARTDWRSAAASFKELKHSVKELGTPITEPLSSLIHYVTGLIHQGTGDTAAALAIFFGRSLALPALGSPSYAIRRDMHILAMLNAVLIIREPSHPQHGALDSTLAALEPLCIQHPSKNIQAAFNLIRATASSENSTVKLKHYLQLALQAARSISNTQITCIVLNFMSWKFFRGVVGEQAEKSAVVGQTLARKDDNSLWLSVADGILADTLRLQGKTQEADAVYSQSLQISKDFPPGLQRSDPID
ncbi:hypothetical protein L228DRAFT_170253 [Xylona heveae TC161]|uniref:75k gamma secalin n=1 Tax=Xylona heveae (strain CBS 132557 / TC161) TaxID=1328760 RepID=A0A165FS67_XYLHT|nr:hypothetical protein L228DRAFT_170253 [Xylona heveae TC161]KZF21311.1 hypothetical protein L228DRAFT_170253 [Xylona heveae TC161]